MATVGKSKQADLHKKQTQKQINQKARKKRYCKQEGCSKLQKSRGYCIRHGEGTPCKILDYLILCLTKCSKWLANIKDVSSMNTMCFGSQSRKDCSCEHEQNYNFGLHASEQTNDLWEGGSIFLLSNRVIIVLVLYGYAFFNSLLIRNALIDIHYF